MLKPKQVAAIKRRTERARKKRAEVRATCLDQEIALTVLAIPPHLIDINARRELDLEWE